MSHAPEGGGFAGLPGRLTSLGQLHPVQTAGAYDGGDTAAATAAIG